MTSNFLCDDHIPGSVPCANCEPDPRFLPSPDPMSAPTSTPETRTISWLRSELDKAHAGLAKAREELDQNWPEPNITQIRVERDAARTRAGVAETELATAREELASAKADRDRLLEQRAETRSDWEHAAQHGAVTRDVLSRAIFEAEVECGRVYPSAWDAVDYGAMADALASRLGPLGPRDAQPLRNGATWSALMESIDEMTAATTSGAA